jgi:ABC-type multidrug transport system fused ATPase/permease subunit
MFKGMGKPPYALWSIWKQLSIAEHIFVLTLCALCIYSTLLVVSTMLRLRSIKKPTTDRELASAEHCVDALRNRCTSLWWAMQAALYLFGIVLFLAFQTTGLYLMGDAVEVQLLGSFVVNCAFATNVIVVFFILHLVRWLVVSRLNKYSKQLSQSQAQLT